MLPPELEQQQERLRRAVDDWRCGSHDLLADLSADPYSSSSSSSAAVDPHASVSDPVRTHLEPLEHSDLQSLLDSDNVDMSKLVTVLSYDCIEISRMCRHASKGLYRQLLLFGRRSSLQEVVLEGEPQKAFGQSLPLFMKLNETVSGLTDVLGNLLLQLNAIYSPRDRNDKQYRLFKSVSLRTVFGCLGEGLAVFLVMDEILKQNGRVKGHLSLFSRMLNKVKLEPETFDISYEDLDFLDQVVHNVEKLLDLGLFQILLLEKSPWNEILQKIRSNRKLIDACASCINDGLLEALQRLDTRKEYPLDRRMILPHISLFVFFAHVSAELPDKKLAKVIGETLHGIPFIYVESNIRIIMLDLLKSQCPPPLMSWPTLKEANKENNVIKSNYLMHLTEVHLREWQSMKDALSCWIASFQAYLHPPMEICKSDEYVRFHLRQIIQGILLANRMQILALSMLDLHTLLEIPIKRENFNSLSHMIVLLKVVQNMFRKKRVEIIQSLPHMINLIQADIEQHLLPRKVYLQSEVKDGRVGKMRFLGSLIGGSKGDDSRLSDSLSVVLMSLQLLQGGGSHQRQLILSITLDIAQSTGFLDIDLMKVTKDLRKLATVVEFQSIVEEVTNCSFLYWRKDTIGDFFSIIYTDFYKFSWLQCLVDAFCDGLWLLEIGQVGRHTQKLYEEEIENAVKNAVVLPLCRDIETDLRLHVHSSHLKGAVHVNPRKTGVRNLSWFLKVKPLRFPSKLIDIGILVESHLNSALYNHSAMSAYNWKIYYDMRLLAEFKYGLLLDENLPVCDYGLELSEVVQNLQSFASNYHYDINNQIFIEKVSNCKNRKSLRVLGVQHVAFSLATVGPTAVTTIMDKIIGFLAHKFASLSGILQGNAVRSHLVKEFKCWKNEEGPVTKHSLAQMESFSTAMRGIPFDNHEMKFLEQLQSIITEMGNILGLVRNLHAGISHNTCKVSGLISQSAKSASFMESCRSFGFSEETVTSGKLLDTFLENKSISIKYDNYFAFLVRTFAERNEYDHLKDFCFVTPALIINLIDSKLHYKDKTLRKVYESGNHVTAEGGLVIGVAYILKVTGQEELFDRMRWFTSAKIHLNEVISSIENSRSPQQQKGSSALASLNFWKQAPTPSVSAEAQKVIDKLTRYQKNLELIECWFNISRTIIS